MLDLDQGDVFKLGDVFDQGDKCNRGDMFEQVDVLDGSRRHVWWSRRHVQSRRCVFKQNSNSVMLQKLS